MKKLLSVSAFLLVVGITVGSSPAQAVLRICDTFCPVESSGGLTCTCSTDSNFPGRSTTCSNWVWDCTYP